MKQLSKLGISPVPWGIHDVVNLHGDGEPTGKWLDDGDGNDLITELSGDDVDMITANARLIAAAPDIYEALREAVVEVCHDCPSCGQHPDYECHGDRECFARKWRTALAEASGESEVKE